MTVLLLKNRTWSDDAIEEGVCSILAQNLGIPAGTIRPEMHLEDGLGVDSLALIQTQFGIEDHFEIVTPDLDAATMDGLRSVADLVEWVARVA